MDSLLHPLPGTDVAAQEAPANVVIGGVRGMTPRAVSAACARAVACARPGQTIVLAADVAVGTTRALLVEPLVRRGLVPGTDVFVAYSAPVADRESLRLVGGVTDGCAMAGASALFEESPDMVVARTVEAAELAGRLESIYHRTVSIDAA